MVYISSKQKIWQHWQFVEDRIKKETHWLEQAIPTFLQKETVAPKGCRDCFMRRIALLIISGKVVARDISRSPKLKDFWLDSKTDSKKGNPKISHGSDWHRKMMERIENHFLHLGFDVEREPIMHQGRADLGVYKDNTPTLYIEIGTTSFYKLWLNLAVKDKFVYLIVPDDNRLIEFRKK